MEDKIRDLLEELDGLKNNCKKYKYNNRSNSEKNLIEGYIDGVEEVKALIYSRLLD